MALEDAAAAADAKDPATAGDAPAKDGAAAASPEAGKAGAADDKAGAAAAVGADGKPVAAAAEVADSTSILDPDGDADGDGEEGAEGEAKPEGEKDPAAKDGDKKPAELPPDWSKVREKASTQYAKTVEARLAKTLTAAALPAELAKQKAAFEKYVAKYGSPEAALIAAFNADQKIRTGSYKAPLPADATDGEKAEWRKENGIPDEPKAYEIPKVAGHQWTEADAPMLDSFKEAAFSGNLNQTQLNAVTTWYAGAVEAAKQQILERQTQIDRADTKATRDVLREELEGDFGPAMTLMTRLLDKGFPEGVGDAIKSARTADGRRIINNPHIAKFLIENAQTRWPDGMIHGQVAEAMATEEKELEALMNTDITAYQNKPWKATGKTGSERYYEIMKKKEGKRAA